MTEKKCGGTAKTQSNCKESGQWTKTTLLRREGQYSAIIKIVGSSYCW